ncbi:MAG: Smr/MutS family protein [Rhodoplanes sp.]
MKRKLTDDERRLWAAAIRAVRPLRPGVGPSEPPPLTPPSASEDKDSLPRKLLEQRRPPRPGSGPAPVLAPLPRRDKQRLARGHSPIDARLDLHGMTQAQAHASLLAFVRNAQAAGARIALVITGTGSRAADGERGVLRRQVPLWLDLPEFRRYVLGLGTANIAHGGAGALYVRLRGKRV